MKFIKVHAGNVLINPEHISSVEMAFDMGAGFIFMSSGQRYTVSGDDLGAMKRLLELEEPKVPVALPSPIDLPPIPFIFTAPKQPVEEARQEKKSRPVQAPVAPKPVPQPAKQQPKVNRESGEIEKQHP